MCFVQHEKKASRIAAVWKGLCYIMVMFSRQGIIVDHRQEKKPPTKLQANQQKRDESRRDEMNRAADDGDDHNDGVGSMMTGRETKQ